MGFKHVSVSPSHLEVFESYPRFTYAIPLRTRFRGIEVREGMVISTPQGWVEWSPFVEYDLAEASTWMLAALTAADSNLPNPKRDLVGVNVTVPVVSAEQAFEIVQSSGCRTAKVKVADPRTSVLDDLARLKAVRAALGSSGQIRVDANGAWTVSEAAENLEKFAQVGLQYAEQPCQTTEELAELRQLLEQRGIGVPIAADESIRRFHDWEKIKEFEAADVAILKVQPLGGVAACLEIAEKLALPCVVSSALETSVGISMGVRLAAQLDSDLDCGLNTVRLLQSDLVDKPLIAVDGKLKVSPVTPSKALLAANCAPTDRIAWWEQRFQKCLGYLKNQ